MKTHGLLLGLGGTTAVRRIVTGAAAGLALLVGAGACSTSSSDGGSTCAEDDSISCASGTTGYSCAEGDVRPEATDSSLICSEPLTVNGEDTYCCYTATEVSGGTCSEDFSIQCSGEDEYGFSCSGSDMPQNDYPNLASCDTEDNGATYCCTFQ
jgi:hypothetical protein